MLYTFDKSELTKKLNEIIELLAQDCFDGSVSVELHMTESEEKKRKTIITLVEKL